MKCQISCLIGLYGIQYRLSDRWIVKSAVKRVVRSAVTPDGMLVCQSLVDRQLSCQCIVCQISFQTGGLSISCQTDTMSDQLLGLKSTRCTVCHLPRPTICKGYRTEVNQLQVVCRLP